MVRPGDNKTAVIKLGNRRHLLLSRSGIDNIVIAVLGAAVPARIDQELINIDNRRCHIIGCKRLGKDIMTRPAAGSCVTTVILPGDDKAIAVRRNRGIMLRSIRVRINQELGSYLRTGRIIALAVDIGAAANIGIIAPVAVCPHDDKPTVLQRCDLRIVLLVDDGRVDQELVNLGDRRRNRGRAVLGDKNLGADIGAGATVMTTVILPGDDKAVTVRFNRRIRLGAAGPGIDPELIANCAASRIVPLAKDTTAIPGAIIIPDDHKASVGEHRA